VPLEQVPAKVMEAARKTLPGYTFDTAYKMKIEARMAFEVRGKDKKGKVREWKSHPPAKSSASNKSTQATAIQMRCRGVGTED